MVGVSDLELRLNYQFAFPMRRQNTIDPNDILMSRKFDEKTKLLTVLCRSILTG